MKIHTFRWAVSPCFEDNLYGIPVLYGDATPLSGLDNFPENVVFDECMGKPFLSLLGDLARSHGVAFLEDDQFPQSIGCPLRALVNSFEEINSPILFDAEHDHARIIQLPETDTYAPSYGAIVKAPSDEWVLRGCSSRLPVKRTSVGRQKLSPK